MTPTHIGSNRVVLRLLGVGLVALSLLVIGGCGGAEAQKPAPPTPKGQIPGGGDPQEYQKKMQEIMGGQKGGTSGSPGAGGPVGGAPK